MIDEYCESLESLFLELEDTLRNAASRKKIKDCYGYIPCKISNFFWLIYAAHKIVRHFDPKGEISTFLEVGSGFGFKTAMANQFFKASGIEINKSYCKTAKKLFYDLDVNVADARNYEHYGKFDVIYFYTPMSNPDQESIFEDKLFSQCKENCLILTPTLTPNTKSLPHIYLAKSGCYIIMNTKDKRRIAEARKVVGNTEMA